MIQYRFKILGRNLSLKNRMAPISRVRLENQGYHPIQKICHITQSIIGLLFTEYP